MKEFNPKTVGQKLKKARESCGLTLEQVAQYVGKQPDEISSFENDIPNITLEVLTLLASLYGHSTDYFLFNENEHEEAIAFSFDTTGIKVDDFEVIARINRLTRNLYFLNSIFERRKTGD